MPRCVRSSERLRDAASRRELVCKSDEMPEVLKVDDQVEQLH